MVRSGGSLPEWQIYFLFPILLILVRRWSSIAATLTTTAVVIAGYLVATNVSAFGKFLDLTPVFLALLAFGMLAARITLGSTRWKAWPWDLIAIAWSGIMIGVINQVGSVTIIAQFFWVDLGVGLAVAFIIAALVSERAEWLRVILESRPVAFLGLSPSASI